MNYFDSFANTWNIFKDPVLVFFKRKPMLTSKFGFVMTLLLYLGIIQIFIGGITNRYLRNTFVM